MLKGTARRWKKLLAKYTAKELGLDEEFSLPGVKALLEQFKEQVEKMETFTKEEPPYRFDCF